ncbi:hypothetical protein L6164_034405 [Bauhinia variegata]|uniref:Uncharacterized protein n=1 Tax=Bauhinia variegata TaxID=167791 RepID=A0ACB9KV82_BAUVA|nr:hypothetical protein L6164_034405 [Bauhinia variegata]
MTQHVRSHETNSSVVSVNVYTSASVHLRPSAPPLPVPDEILAGELSPLDLHDPSTNGGDGASCVICWEAPIKGACVACGYMAGCTSCLKEIKANKGVCPICRTTIDQVIRLFAV